MPAIAADANGRATVHHTTTLISLGSGPNGLFDADGSAIVVHASPDDQRTDPSGNSGARIACGVVERS
jgi:Cu-Zn family superoxide dismutase